MTQSGIATFVGGSFERELRDAVVRAVSLDEDALAALWDELDRTASPWLAQYHDKTSGLNLRLHVLETLCGMLPGERLYAIEGVADVILASTGVAAVGDTTAMGTVIARSISPRFGIDFFVRRTDGSLVHHEWFD